MTAERRRHYAPAEAWTRLIETPGITWVCLQYDECAEELAAWERATGIEVHRWDEEDLKNDLESVVGLIACLDKVITAPTAVSSLAGALGVPTWQVDSGSDWTAAGESANPWFPSIRLERLTYGGDWTDVLERVAAAVRPGCAKGMRS